jgi:hypothetical protein
MTLIFLHVVLELVMTLTSTKIVLPPLSSDLEQNRPQLVTLATPLIDDDNNDIDSMIEESDDDNYPRLLRLLERREADMKPQQSILSKPFAELLKVLKNDAPEMEMMSVVDSLFDGQHYWLQPDAVHKAPHEWGKELFGPPCLGFTSIGAMVSSC